MRPVRDVRFGSFPDVNAAAEMSARSPKAVVQRRLVVDAVRIEPVSLFTWPKQGPDPRKQGEGWCDTPLRAGVSEHYLNPSLENYQGRDVSLKRAHEAKQPPTDGRPGRLKEAVAIGCRRISQVFDGDWHLQN